MGEFADMLIDQYYSGGHWEDDYEPYFGNSYTKTKKVLTCNSCGSDHVYWHKRENGTWTLYDKTTKEQHLCKIDRMKFLEDKITKTQSELIELKKELVKLKKEKKNENGN